MEKTRNITYDLMKGITIILMMSAHLIPSIKDGEIGHFIYSFHMPLFMILAGMFAKDIENIPSFKQFTIKNAKRLLLPFVVTMLLRCAWGGLQTVLKHDIAYFMQPLLSLAVASPDVWNTPWGDVYTGPMWFLVALFWIRELFYGLQYVLRNVEEQKRDLIIVAISLVLSILSVYVLFPIMRPFPFCLIQAMTSLAFYTVGWYIHKHPMPWWAYALCVIAWPFSIKYCHITLAYCTMWYYPLAFTGAFGGTYVIYLLCEGISRTSALIESKVANRVSKLFINPITRFLAWCGMYSLPILCMHELEMYSAYLYSFICHIPSLSILIGWGEMGIAVVMTLIILNVPYLKKVYRG